MAPTQEDEIISVGTDTSDEIVSTPVVEDEIISAKSEIEDVVPTSKSFADRVIPQEVVANLSKELGISHDDVRLAINVAGGHYDVRDRYNKAIKEGGDADTASWFAPIRSKLNELYKEHEDKVFDTPFGYIAGFLSSPEMQDVYENIPAKTAGLAHKATQIFGERGLMDAVMSAAEAKFPEERQKWERIREVVKEHAGYESDVITAAGNVAIPGMTGAKIIGAVAPRAASLAARLGVTGKAAELIGSATGSGAYVASSGAIGGIAGAVLAPMEDKAEEAFQGAMWGMGAAVAGQAIGNVAGYVGGKISKRLFGDGERIKQLADVSPVVEKRFEGKETILQDILDSAKKGEIVGDVDQMAGLLGVESTSVLRAARVMAKEADTPVMWSKLSEEAKDGYLEEAKKLLVMKEANKRMDEFVNDAIPKFSGVYAQKGTAFLEAIQKTTNKAALISVMQRLKTLPEERFNQITRITNSEGYRAGKDALLDWADEVMSKKTAEEVTRAGWNKSLKTLAQVQGSEKRVQDLWKSFNISHDIRNQLESIGLQGAVRTKGVVESMLDKTLLAGHVVLDTIDRRYGTNLSVLSGRLNRKEEQAVRYIANKTKAVQQEWAADASNQMNKLSIDPKRFVQFYESNDDAFLQGMTKDQVAFIKETLAPQWKKTMDSLRSDAEKEFGFKLKYLDRYISHQTVDADIAVRRVNKELKRLDSVINNSKATLSLMMKKNKDVKDLIRSVEILSGVEGIKTKEALDKALTALDDVSAVSNNLAPKVTAAFSRSKDGIPLLIREHDPFKIMDRYLKNTFKTIYLRDELTEMLSVAEGLRKAGEKASEKFGKGKSNTALDDASAIQEQVAARMGRPSGAFWERLETEQGRRWAKKVRDSDVGSEEEIRKKIQAPRQLVQGITSLMYASLLSKPQSALRNMTAITTMAGEELGKNGKDYAVRGLMHTVADWKNTIKELKELGVLSERNLSAELMSVGGVAGAKGKIERFAKASNTISNEVMSWCFTRSENAIRASSYMAAKLKLAARDFDFSSVSSPSIKRRLDGGADKLQKLEAETGGTIKQQAERKSQIAEIQKDMLLTLNDHLQTKANFVYNEANKARFLKEIGPLAGSFLRWPSEQFSKLVGKFRAGQDQQLINQVITPLATLGLFQAGYLSRAKEEDPVIEARANAIFGKSNLALLAPVTALSAVINPWGVKPITLKVPMDIYDAITKEDEGKLGQAIYGAIRTFGIAPAFMELAIDDIYAGLILGEGDKPFSSGAKEGLSKFGSPAIEAKQGIKEWFE